MAMDTSLRLLALPLMLLVEEVFGSTRIQIAGDNQSMLFILKTGRNPTMRHLSRTHRVSVAWLHEQHVRENFQFGYVSTDGMAADIFAKSTHAPATWTEARKQINVFATMSELMPYAGLAGDCSASTAVACVCAQSFA